MRSVAAHVNIGCSTALGGIPLLVLIHFTNANPKLRVFKRETLNAFEGRAFGTVAFNYDEWCSSSLKMKVALPRADLFALFEISNGQRKR